jgi:signal transduction histidine kinase
MQSIRKRLSILFVICSIGAILLITLSVNMTIKNKFDLYMIDIQNKRYERIVGFLVEAYKREGKWTESSGIELMHEAYMGNYCLSLYDNNKKLIWGMDPNDISNKLHLNTMTINKNGVYTTKSFELKADDKIIGRVDIGQYSSVLMSEEDINFKTSINKSIMASGSVTLIFIIGLSLYFSRQFSIPIKEVANMSVNLSKGKFDLRSITKSNIVELEELKDSINILAEKLNQQDMLRRRLVADISHEIRTPLNILQNNLEAMIDGVFPVTQERLNYLNEEVVRFGKLLSNLNVLKEFESEGIELNLETVVLDEFLSDICKDFSVAAENKKLILKFDKQPCNNYKIDADRDKLKQVFINLISNAIKFTPAKGCIWVKLYEKDRKLVVEVKDNGIGIKKEDLPFIFERLYRGDKSRNQQEGNGLGLTIVNNILKIHNASIKVESEEGKGSSFRIYFNMKYMRLS